MRQQQHGLHGPHLPHKAQFSQPQLLLFFLDAWLENNAVELVAKAMKFVSLTEFFGCKVSYIISNVQFYQTFDIIVFVKSLRKEVAAAVQVWSRMKVHLYLDVEDFFASNAIRIRIVYQPNTVSTIHMEDMVVV